MSILGDYWISEHCEMWPGRAFSVKVTECLHEEQTPYQKIELYQTETCGKMLVLDGAIQFTEYDEFSYQEMMTHPALFSHPRPERILIIGGGDGGIVREVLRHSLVKQVDVCEIDERVVDVCRQYVPSMSSWFDDERVSLHFHDGAEFVNDKNSYYDVVIVDSADPIGPAEVLFSASFYEQLKCCLRSGGIVAAQGESFFMHPDVTKSLLTVMKSLFPVYGYCFTLVPTYAGGNLGVCFGSLEYEVKEPQREIDPKVLADLKYYTPEIHRASFVLPAFGQRMLDEVAAL